MSDFLPYSTQWIDETDIEAVADVLRGDWLTTGPHIDALEEHFAEYCGARHAVAVANGTAALHLVALAVGLGPGDVHITSPITFLATANCARYCGADVDFADVEPDSITLDPAAVAARAERRPRGDGAGRVKMLAPVDYGGTPADWPAFRRLADRLGAFLLEDGCHAVGAEYLDAPGGERVRVGACAHADACVFSLHPVKHFTTGEGGLITTNDEGLARELKRLRSHGMVHDPARTERHDGPWYYEMPTLGFNYRLTDIQAALGTSQLRRLPEFVRRRRALAAKYDELLADCDALSTPARPPGRFGSYHLYPIRLRDAERRREVFEALRAAKLGVQIHYIPVHLQPYYRKLGGFAPGDFPHAEDFYRRTISLPLFPKMKEADVVRVVETVRGLLEAS